MDKLTLILCSSLILFVCLGVECVSPFRADYSYHAPTDSYYKVSTVPKSWKLAKVICEQEGASLFYPSTEEELQYVTNLVALTKVTSRSMLLGIHDIFQEGIYSTIDGKPVNEIYTNWKTGEPSSRLDTQDCMSVLLHRQHDYNQMLAVSCDYVLPFVCQRKASTLVFNEDCKTHDTDYIYNSKMNTCHKLHLKPKTWSQAYSACILEGSRLMVVDSEEKAKLLTSYLSTNAKEVSGRNYNRNCILVGFHDLFGEGVFRTLNGDTLEEAGYARWSVGHPLDSGTLCGALDTGGLLLDVDCTRRALFVCERDVESIAYADAYLGQARPEPVQATTTMRVLIRDLGTDPSLNPGLGFVKWN